MEGRFENIAIRGIKAVIPGTVIENASFADKLGERRCKKQIKLTGVKTRHVSQNQQTTADLAYEAGRLLMDSLKWDPEEISVLVFATQNPLFVLPSTAFLLQKKLGISKNAVVFDVNLGCSGALVGMQIVSSLLQQKGNHGKGLLLVADAVYAPNEIERDNPDALADQMLFGSAGCAVALEVAEKVEPIVIESYSDGIRYDAIIRRLGNLVEMKGEAVFEFGVNDVASGLIDFRKKFQLKEDDIDFYSFHQAQALMLSTIDSVCDIPEEKEIRSLEEYGNTNGSSVLVNLCANREKFIGKEHVHALLCAFGVGLSWAYVYTQLPVQGILPISFCDVHYEK